MTKNAGSTALQEKMDALQLFKMWTWGMGSQEPLTEEKFTEFVQTTRFPELTEADIQAVKPLVFKASRLSLAGKRKEAIALLDLEQPDPEQRILLPKGVRFG